MPYLRALSVVCIVVIQSICATVQETSSRPGSSSETATLPPMVVSATRGGPRSAEELPVSVTVLAREEIEASPGLTIDEILRTTPSSQLQVANLFDEDYTVDAFGGLNLRGAPRQVCGGVRVALP